MNRSIGNVFFSGLGAGGPAIASETGGTVRSTSAADVAIQLSYARLVVVVPGYGMAVAQAQRAVADLAAELERRGVEVLYAIHPVAGRMPGHMNVLLAEADVPYEQLKEMDDINGEFGRTDVALVIGANDVTNPAARTDRRLPDLRHADPRRRQVELDHRPQALDVQRLRGHRQPALLRPEDRDAVRRRQELGRRRPRAKSNSCTLRSRPRAGYLRSMLARHVTDLPRASPHVPRRSPSPRPRRRSSSSTRSDYDQASTRHERVRGAPQRRERSRRPRWLRRCGWSTAPTAPSSKTIDLSAGEPRRRRLLRASAARHRGELRPRRHAGHRPDPERLARRTSRSSTAPRSCDDRRPTRARSPRLHRGPGGRAGRHRGGRDGAEHRARPRRLRHGRQRRRLHARRPHARRRQREHLVRRPPPSDTAPSVESSDPATGDTGVEPGANLRVTFSEPVTAADGASRSPATARAVALAVSRESDTTYVLDPQQALPGGTTCTLRVEGDDYRDDDADDPPDTGSDYSATFTTEASPACASTTSRARATSRPTAACSSPACRASSPPAAPTASSSRTRSPTATSAPPRASSSSRAPRRTPRSRPATRGHDLRPRQRVPLRRRDRDRQPHDDRDHERDRAPRRHRHDRADPGRHAAAACRRRR